MDFPWGKYKSSSANPGNGRFLHSSGWVLEIHGIFLENYGLLLDIFGIVWVSMACSFVVSFFRGSPIYLWQLRIFKYIFMGENYHKHWPFWGSKFWDNPKRKCQLNLHWDSMKCMQIISNKYWCWICIAVGFNQAQHMLLLSIQDHHAKQSSPRMDKL